MLATLPRAANAAIGGLARYEGPVTMRVIRLVMGLSALALVVPLGVAGVWFARDALRGDGPWPGTTLGGRTVPSQLPFSVWLEGERTHYSALEASLTSPEGTTLASFEQLGLELDVAGTLQACRDQRGQGSLARRLRQWWAARRGQVELRPRFHFERQRAMALLAPLADQLRRSPRHAKVDIEAHRREPAQAGRELHLERCVELVSQLYPGEEATVELPFSELSARQADGLLGELDPSLVLGSFETSYRNKAGPRAINIQTAAKYLEGFVLAPDAVFSFNAVVGARVPSRGFVEAPVIREDELEPGFGGGVCQVATAVHAAAVLGGLTVVERRSHSRPSGYAPLGLDATVVYGEVDLKLKNELSTSVVLHASFPEKHRLRIEWLGAYQDAVISHHAYVKGKQATYRRIVTHSELATDAMVRRQKPAPGMDVVSTIDRKSANGMSSSRQFRSRYFPVPEVYWVGADVRPEQLPPPDSALSGVVFNGQLISGTLSETAARRLPTDPEPAP